MSMRVATELVIALLRRGRTRVAWGWTRGEFARDRLGRPVEPWEPRACQFCALGALRADAGDRYGDHLLSTCARVALENSIFYSTDLAAYNDDPAIARDDILALFDKTIARLEAACAS